jgi:hypothetical protein
MFSAAVFDIDSVGQKFYNLIRYQFLLVKGSEDFMIKLTVASKCNHDLRSLRVGFIPRSGVAEYHRSNLRRKSSQTQRRCRDLAPGHLQLTKLGLMYLRTLRKGILDYGIVDLVVVYSRVEDRLTYEP